MTIVVRRSMTITTKCTDDDNHADDKDYNNNAIHLYTHIYKSVYTSYGICIGMNVHMPLPYIRKTCWAGLCVIRAHVSVIIRLH